MTVQQEVMAEREADTGELVKLEWLHSEDEDLFILYVGDCEYHFFNGKEAMLAFHHPYSVVDKSTAITRY